MTVNMMNDQLESLVVCDHVPLRLFMISPSVKNM